MIDEMLSIQSSMVSIREHVLHGQGYTKIKNPVQ